MYLLQDMKEPEFKFFLFSRVEPADIWQADL